MVKLYGKIVSLFNKKTKKKKQNKIYNKIINNFL